MPAPRPAADKARDALDLATRKVDRIDARLSKAQTVVDNLRGELRTAKAELVYAEANPALDTPEDTP